MAGKQTEAMKKAKSLIVGGMNAHKAAKEAGITPQAIYMAPWYKQMREQNK